VFVSVICYIGIGSNLGDLSANINLAITKITSSPDVASFRVSRFFTSEPLTHGNDSQPWYLNAVLEIQTTWPLQALFTQLQKIELDMGRKRRAKWEARVIDLDILFYGTVIYDDTQLRIPHRGIPQRRFVLEPLCDLAPDFLHPEYQMTLSEILSSAADPLAVHPLEAL